MSTINEVNPNASCEQFPDFVPRTITPGILVTPVEIATRHASINKKLRFQRNRGSVDSKASDSDRTLCDEQAVAPAKPTSLEVITRGPRSPVEAPGSVLLIEPGPKWDETKGAPSSAFTTQFPAFGARDDSHTPIPTPCVARKRSRNGKLCLEPQPEDTKNDPLNWAVWKRASIITSLICLSFYVGAMTSSLWLGQASGSNTLISGFTYLQTSVGTATFLLGMAISQACVTPLALLYGKRLTYMLSIVVTTLALVLLSTCRTLPLMALARCIMGFGLGTLEVLVLTSMSELIFLQHRATFLSLHVAAYLGGMSAIPSIATAITLALDWHRAVLILTALSGALLVITFFTIPDTYYDRRPILLHSKLCRKIRRRANTAHSTKTYLTHCSCHDEEKDPHPGKQITYEHLSPAVIETRALERRRKVLEKINSHNSHEPVPGGMVFMDAVLHPPMRTPPMFSPPLTTPPDNEANIRTLKPCLSQTSPRVYPPGSTKNVHFPRTSRSRASSTTSPKTISPRRPSLSRALSQRTTSSWRAKPVLRLDLENILLDRDSVGAITGHTSATGYQDGRFSRGPDTAISPSLTTAGISMGYPPTIGGDRTPSAFPHDSHGMMTAYMIALKSDAPRSWASRLRVWNGRVIDESYATLLAKPWILLGRCPGLLLWAALTYGVCVALITTLPAFVSALAKHPEHAATAIAAPDAGVMRPALLGLATVAGGVVGALGTGLLTDWLAVASARHNAGVFEPESRLRALLPATILGAAGLFGFAFLVEMRDVHVALLGLCMGLIGCGCSSATVVGLTYLVDCFAATVAEGGVVLGVFKNLVPALILTVVADKWVVERGAREAYIIFGAVYVAVMLSGVLIYVFGRKIRVRGSRQTIFEQA